MFQEHYNALINIDNSPYAFLNIAVSFGCDHLV